ncbi:type 1 fimbrial protein [Buttiauxella sp. B2]|nr:type 1 fimbrial protein [Buttiauxella sp. B2]
MYYLLIGWTLYLGWGSVSLAANQGNGRVSMQGSIIDTACAIDMVSRYQVIEVMTLPLGQIMRDGRGAKVPLGIRLVNCTLTPSKPGQPDWSSFVVTFDGLSTRGNLFGIGGGAEGIGIEIADANGVVAIPGVPMPAGKLKEGSIQLDYTLSLVGNKDTLRPGNYQASVRFKLDYF